MNMLTANTTPKKAEHDQQHVAAGELLFVPCSFHVLRHLKYGAVNVGFIGLRVRSDDMEIVFARTADRSAAVT